MTGKKAEDLYGQPDHELMANLIVDDINQLYGMKNIDFNIYAFNSTDTSLRMAATFADIRRELGLKEEAIKFERKSRLIEADSAHRTHVNVNIWGNKMPQILVAAARINKFVLDTYQLHTAEQATGYFNLTEYPRLLAKYKYNYVYKTQYTASDEMT